MSMRVTATVTDPGATPVTLAITMPLAEWQRLHAQLSTAYPSWKLGSAIRLAAERLMASHTEAVEVDP